ncbi:hypothetical protein PBT90_05685 [Algoriphagus halophytocola]|uniref:Beta-lactamase-inhibitor-like PepSY-like domain-containing protein n=1 Tax=Algoriphagus halophytocola TaxID=2991499 RepID=A0ABY6MGY7_9BACT|nr:MULTISPECIES: hypothetical protein [unclassified Algoriphagus]UZD22908.1 hypothetical protein OM944_00135 [Algoriphagus sp. TR-M5]WBL44176.1 hypothetical protein PBT90_05685 [Algoriphagus sp. TR-M9]
MKTSSLIIALTLGIGLISCNEREENSHNDPTGKLEVDQENGQIPEGDSTRYLVDGSTMPVVIEMTDSINMPKDLINVIENTDDLHPDSILVKRRFIENGITYYELEFKMKGNISETFTFDEDGKRREVLD